MVFVSFLDLKKERTHIKSEIRIYGITVGNSEVQRTVRGD